MRFYYIKITPAAGGTPQIYSTRSPNSSSPNSGVFNGAALQIDLDIFQTWYNQPAQNGFLKIYGVDFNSLGQANNLNPIVQNDTYKYSKIEISVGMSKGLPYANPAQANIIINGSILQSFGNWQGNLISLDLIITNATYDPNVNVNLSWEWKKGQTLESAVKGTLNKAYPDVPIYGQYSNDLIYTETQPYKYPNLSSFSQAVIDLSKQIIKSPNYDGAQIASTSSGFLLFDGTVPPSKTHQIEYTDIIGNLTWIETFIVQAKLVIRGDLNIGDYITFPASAPVVNSAASFAQLRNNIPFNGKFIIDTIRHVGSSRQSDANSWVTIVNCLIPGQI
jgi:hypothetical protein